MKLLFYPRIALMSIKNNKRYYKPYIFTCIAIVAINYIISYLGIDKNLAQDPMIARAQQSNLYLGIIIMAIFSLFFLFYTNSFLTSRRNKEFGLYNVLGMAKKNICYVLFFETVFIAFISIIIGLGFGILFSKFAQLFLIRIVNGEVFIRFTINKDSCLNVIVFFSAIFALLYIYNCLSLRMLNTIELVKAQQKGEKKPKANWLFAFSGIVFLIIAYYLAIKTDNAIKAFMYFFVAVILVIIATYLIFIASSVALCSILKKKKNFYYKTENFISVSSMAFRMKRNGAGLATICILSTMVLVTISSTACLYFGISDVLESQYPKDINIEYVVSDSNLLTDNTFKDFDILIDNSLNNFYLTKDDVINYEYISLSGQLDNNVFKSDISTTTTSINPSDIMVINFIPLSDFNRLANENVKLEENEALLFKYDQNYQLEEVEFFPDVKYKIVLPEEKDVKTKFELGKCKYNKLFDVMCLVVDDFVEDSRKIMSSFDKGFITTNYIYQFNINNDQLQNQICNDIYDAAKIAEIGSVSVKSRTDASSELYGMYGSLFFIGVILSIVFMFATVLIIYYKQVSEGYEDQMRFEIMKKVGISKKDIRQTIKSQMLLVFYLPLLLAIIHVCFAFPMIRGLLSLLGFFNTTKFIIAMIISIICYAIIYSLVYLITTKNYYDIVNS